MLVLDRIADKKKSKWAKQFSNANGAFSFVRLSTGAGDRYQDL